jgi:hypoxia up-regulated 1
MLRLANHLAKEFKEKTKVDVFKHPKAILKLYKEAERVKNVLSANSDHVAQVEGLVDELDFKSSKITRIEFERICADLFDRLQRPLEDALKSAEVTFVIAVLDNHYSTNKLLI